MELFLHIWTNLEYFKLLNKWFLLSTWKTDREIASFFMKNFSWEIKDDISPQYETNFMAIRELKKRYWNDVFKKIWWIYYWSDNCEYLLAHKSELEQATKLFKEFNEKYPPHKIRTFTFVTPYVWNKMLKNLEASLEYLNNLKIKNPIEVVINDLWVLNLIKKKFTNLKPVYGRQTHKLLKTPLIDTYWLDAHPAGDLIKNKSSQEIEEVRNKIKEGQKKFYASSEASLPIMQNFLQKNNIDRVALDYMQDRENLYNNERYGELWLDVYYPWALIMSWRLCDTSAIENPVRWNYATDEICPRTCFRYDIFYKIKTSWYKLIQRWNAGFRSELNLDYLPKSFDKHQKNRLIFAPFVTV